MFTQEDHLTRVYGSREEGGGGSVGCGEIWVKVWRWKCTIYPLGVHESGKVSDLIVHFELRDRFTHP